MSVRDAGTASRFFYCAKANRTDRDEGLEALPDRTLHRVNAGGLEDDPRWAPVVRKNHHPTVKPTELMRYLVRLVTPPGGVVLDPFMGSGSTGKAARLEGFRFVGVDLDPAFVEIARARIAWADRVGGSSGVATVSPFEFRDMEGTRFRVAMHRREPWLFRWSPGRSTWCAFRRVEARELDGFKRLETPQGAPPPAPPQSRRPCRA